jgi:hypothetical protein
MQNILAEKELYRAEWEFQLFGTNPSKVLRDHNEVIENKRCSRAFEVNE